ncbi:MAG: hypothetical protein KF847_20735 [Pirellulales bacterium]|nr:hypothetical protein [Pirellulales bacterium]
MAGQETFEESARRWSTTCLACQEPCGPGEAKRLALGHVMHWDCYDAWLRRQDDLPRTTGRRAALSATDSIRSFLRSRSAPE